MIRFIFLLKIFFVHCILPIDYGTKTATIMGAFEEIGRPSDFQNHPNGEEKIKLPNGEITFYRKSNETAFRVEIIIDATLPTHRIGSQ